MKMKKNNFKQVLFVGYVKNIFENDDEKASDHCRITGKFRGAAHWSCNINLHLEQLNNFL